MSREPHPIPDAWVCSWRGTFTHLHSIGDWDVVLWEGSNSSCLFVLMYPASYILSFLRVDWHTESLSNHTPPPEEVITFARNYRALVS